MYFSEVFDRNFSAVLFIQTLITITSSRSADYSGVDNSLLTI